MNTILSLDEIQQHPDYPFFDIRQLEQYLMAQFYWLIIVKGVLSSDANQWEYWLPQDQNLSGSNIISIRKLNRDKGIVIDQQCVAADWEKYQMEHRDLVIFLAYWEEKEDSQGMPYLRMFTKISSKTLHAVDWFLRYWNKPDTTEEKMQQAIDYYYSKT